MLSPAVKSRLVVAFLCCISALSGYAQQADSIGWWNRNSTYAVAIDEVAVEVSRPMREIGLQQTILDTVALHDNIALSMADVLSLNSSIFVKQHGRATLSTVSFRGTSASHTQVTWNGLKIQSPMLGMTDFSMIPSYLIDDATLLHGSSSVTVSSGGIGGAVLLKSHAGGSEGFDLRFVQGVGSYSTFDEFLSLGYGNGRWQLSTKAVYASSQNDFHYTNRNKKENIYDDEYNIIDSYYPTEVNRNCDFRDFHLLQQISHTLKGGDKLNLEAWYLNTNRGIPLLSVDYNDTRQFENRQREHTLRSLLEWEHQGTNIRLNARGGYIYSLQKYNFAKERGDAQMMPITSTTSRLNTVYASFEASYYLAKWLFTATAENHLNFVDSRDRVTEVGYDKNRNEMSLLLGAKWSPTKSLGLSLSLREELYDKELSPLIPALMVDWLISKRGTITLKGSVARNYRYPSLNDLYFQPGGNSQLRPEKGVTYDAGISFDHKVENSYSLEGALVWFDSYIDDWILWRPTFKGFWTPENVERVHAYGIEANLSSRIQLAPRWQMTIDGSYSWTPSKSNGKQLIYVPLHSTSVGCSLMWRSWRLTYKGHYYSERFTTTDNISGRLTSVDSYFLSDGSLEKRFVPKWADLSVKFSAMNIFDVEYESVLARPMPGFHFEIFLEIHPRWGKKSR